MLDFPSSPTEGQIFQSFIYRSGAWAKVPLKTALPKNYLVNPAMQISQQNGDAMRAAATSATYYAADQWASRWNIVSGGMQAARWNVFATYGFNTSYYRTTTAKILATTEYALLTQNIEGRRMADWQWGTPQAKDLVLCFSTIISALQPTGTYSVRIANNPIPATRTYIAAFNIPATNVWQDHVIVIPGDTVGTWTKDYSVGARLDFTIAAGPSQIGVPGWQSAGLYAVPGQANGASVVNGDFHIGRCGLYLDPYKTGLPPPFVVPDYLQELRRCQRYWYKQYAFRGVVAATSSFQRVGAQHPVPMRVNAGISNVGSVSVWDGFNSTGMAGYSTIYNNEYYAEFDMGVGAVFTTPGRAGLQYWTNADNYIALSARM